jgi:hypothetical protein
MASPFNPRAWSYSALKKFENCARQYSEIVVYRNYQDVFTSPKGDYGDRLHKAADAYVHHGGDIDNDFKFLQPTLDVLRALPGQKLTEHKMAVLPSGAPTRWNDPDRWFQGIADLCIVSDAPTAYCLDYKTGDVKYADTDQLELMAMLMFSHFPHVQKVKGRLLFVLSQQPRDRVVTREENDKLWQKWRERDARRVAAIEAKNFPPKESGLCKKHCIVTSCEHNGRR